MITIQWLKIIIWLGYILDNRESADFSESNVDLFRFLLLNLYQNLNSGLNQLLMVTLREIGMKLYYPDCWKSGIGYQQPYIETGRGVISKALKEVTNTWQDMPIIRQAGEIDEGYFLPFPILDWKIVRGKNNKSAVWDGDPRRRALNTFDSPINSIH